jgi:hypothetical protein
MKLHPTEEQIQGAVAAYLDAALPPDAVYFHCPNGGHRHPAVAAKLKWLGVKPGVPDIFIVWRGRSIFIELKAHKGSLSDAQKAMQQRLILSGAVVFEVARSVDEVEAFLTGVGIPLHATTGRAA